MEILTTVKELREALGLERMLDKTIGFVPTMGALHEGHLSLVTEAMSDNDRVVCSIFINPTQFNDPEDLKKYPRPLGQDIKMLRALGCHYLFLPSAEEVYPEDLSIPDIDLNGLDLPMEGAQRPGHFKGVVQVVYRLLQIVIPHRLYMGQKDFQQYTIIAHMLRQTKSFTKIVCSPIVRESDGLAMSSRNIQLSPQGRALAPILHKVLYELEYYVNSQPNPLPQEAISQAIARLQEQGIEDIDYLEIVDGHTLQAIKDFELSSFVIACAVVRIDGVRLLDNVILKKKA